MAKVDRIMVMVFVTLTLLIAVLLGALSGSVAEFDSTEHLRAIGGVFFVILGVVWAWFQWPLAPRATRASRRGPKLADVRAAADSSPDAALVIQDDEVAYVNLPYAQMMLWGEEAKRLIGKSVSQLVHPQSLVDLSSLLRQTSPGSANTRSLRLACGDGSFQMHLVERRGGGDSTDPLLLHVHGVGADEPQSRAVDLKTANGGEDIALKLPIALFRLDREGDILFANQGWQTLIRLVGPSSDGRAFASFIHPEQRDALSAKLALLLGGRSSEFSEEIRLIRSDDSLAYVDLRCYGVTDRDGVVTGAIGAAIDISHRLRNEETLRQTKRSMHTLVDNLPAMIYRGQNNRRWSWEFLSEGSYELTGYEARELLGDDGMSFVQLIHADDREFVWNEVQSKLIANEPYALTYRLVDRSGKTKWVWDQGRGIYSARGEVIALEGFIIEVTRRRLAEEASHRRALYERSTGLANMSVFLDRIEYGTEMARRLHLPCGVFVVRLRNLGMMRERITQDFADRVLVLLGVRLQPTISHLNTATLLDQQDYALFISDFSASALKWCKEGAQIERVVGRDEDAALDMLADELKHLMESSFKLEGGQFTIETSVGWTKVPEERVDATALLDRALEAAG